MAAALQQSTQIDTEMHDVKQTYLKFNLSKNHLITVAVIAHAGVS